MRTHQRSSEPPGMSNRLSSVFPRPSAADADDVVWTLQTAAVQWQRGLRADAIVWVRKAADTATQLGHGGRAEELRTHAARLAEFLWTDPEETIQDAPVLPSVLPPRGLGGRRSADEAEEILELEELDEELEFTENDLPTPDDAVSDISEEDLSYYREGGDGSEQTNVLPDDLDLRSDSQPPPDGQEPYLSITPEPDEESDAYLSISPDEEAEELEEPRAAGVMNGSSGSPSPASTDRPTRPHIDRQPIARAARSELSDVRSPTLPSPVVSNPPRARTLGSESVPIRSHHASPGPTLEELARLLAPNSPMAKRSLAPAVTPLPVASALSPPSSEAGQPPSVDGLDFESVEALADLPEEAQAELAASGQLVTLTSGQEIVLREGAALITRGTVHVTLTYSDVSAARIGAGAVVAARGSVEAGPLRLIADSAQTHVVTWTEEKMTQAMRDCPWVVDDLRLLADRFQAHASAGLGPLGERLDDALRAAVYERLTVRVLSPEESIAERGKPLKGLFVVAVGELNVSSDSVTHRPIRPGEFLFPSCVIGAEPAPHDVKAGPKGGLVLFATRPVAHELMMSVPPLLEILAS
jgi:hypothetical protein